MALADWLRQHDVDAVATGLSTRVLLDLTAGVAAATTDAALDQLRAAGIDLEGSVQVPSRRRGPRRG